jgi:hypothetical protein
MYNEQRAELAPAARLAAAGWQLVVLVLHATAASHTGSHSAAHQM